MAILGSLVSVNAMARLDIRPISMKSPLGTTLIILAVFAFVFILMNRDTWLPFLGEAALPPPVLALRVPSDASYTVPLRTVPVGATHVVYWAAETSPTVASNPWEAYNKYDNSGVAEALADGSAILKLRCPGKYRAKGKILPRHVHWRAVFPSGILGPVETLNVQCA